MLCSRCSQNLPDGSQFCLKCGQSVLSATNSAALATTSPAPRWQRLILLWLLLLTLLGAMLWAVTSEIPAAVEHGKLAINSPSKLAIFASLPQLHVCGKAR